MPYVSLRTASVGLWQRVSPVFFSYATSALWLTLLYFFVLTFFVIALGRPPEKVPQGPGPLLATYTLGTYGAVADSFVATGWVKTSVTGLERAAGESEATAAAVSEAADRAGVVMEGTVHGIETLRGAVSDAHQRIAALGRRSDDIDKVVDFISEVAGRTNLLSLNASIIAAQAGAPPSA